MLPLLLDLTLISFAGIIGYWAGRRRRLPHRWACPYGDITFAASDRALLARIANIHFDAAHPREDTDAPKR